MSYVFDEKPDLEDVVEHFGVKGMRWGVRRTRNVQKRSIDPLKRVASGEGSKRDKAKVALRNYTIGDLAKGRSLKKSAARRVDIIKKNQDKVNAGQDRVRNVLALTAGVRIKDLDLT